MKIAAHIALIIKIMCSVRPFPKYEKQIEINIKYIILLYLRLPI